jgi:hypothetical protein
MAGISKTKTSDERGTSFATVARQARSDVFGVAALVLTVFFAMGSCAPKANVAPVDPMKAAIKAAITEEILDEVNADSASFDSNAAAPTAFSPAPGAANLPTTADASGFPPSSSLSEAPQSFGNIKNHPSSRGQATLPHGRQAASDDFKATSDVFGPRANSQKPRALNLSRSAALPFNADTSARIPPPPLPPSPHGS